MFLPSRGSLLAACLLVVLFAHLGSASGQLRVVNYNVAQLLGDDAALEDVIASLMVDDQPGFETPVSVFIFQEVRQADVVTLGQIINAAAPPGVLYAQGTYTNFGEDPVAGAQAMFYRAGMLIEDQSQHIDIATGGGRYTDRWCLRLLGYDSPAATFYIYSSHLKASSGGSNQQARFEGVQNIRANADLLPVGSKIIYGGDMNFYSNNEPGYVHFFSAGPGTALDPLGAGSWGGLANAIKHTQSPRSIMADGLVGAGLDDRFDFQLSSLSMHTGNGLALIPGSYRSFGNDGLHYDQAINSGNNFYYPDDVARSNAIADALHDASDHIPVVVDYQVPARMTAGINPSSFGRVIQGAAYTIDYAVQNSAPFANSPVGADVLDFTVTGSSGIMGQAFGEAWATEPIVLGSLDVDTSTAGVVAGVVTFTSSSEAVQPAMIERNVSGTIVRPSAPSFAAKSLEGSLEVTFELDSDTGVHEIHVPVYNHGYDELQALLNIDAVDGVTGPYSFVSGLAEDIGATPAMLVLTFDTTGLADGAYGTSVTIHTSDENLPGAGQTALALSLMALVGDAALCEADLNSDHVVDVSDLLVLLGGWGSCPRSGGCEADLNGDAVVDVSDLLILLGEWGQCSFID